jgi:hypothetical protein
MVITLKKADQSRLVTILLQLSSTAHFSTTVPIVNNPGTGPPLLVLSSHMNSSNAIFSGNQVLEYNSEILLFNLTFKPYGLHFSKIEACVVYS